VSRFEIVGRVLLMVSILLFAIAVRPPWGGET